MDRGGKCRGQAEIRKAKIHVKTIYHSIGTWVHTSIAWRSNFRGRQMKYNPLINLLEPKNYSTVKNIIYSSLIASSLQLFGGCATEPERQTTWTDVTGNNRSEGLRFQDHSACSLLFQQARTQAELTNPMPEAGSCRTCATLNAATVLMRQQNIDNYANSAYFNCMGVKGWRKQ